MQFPEENQCLYFCYFPGPEKDERDETHPRFVSVQQIDRFRMLAIRHVLECAHFHRPERRVFPCVHHAERQEIPAFLIPRDTVSVQPPVIRLFPGSTPENAVLSGRHAFADSLQRGSSVADEKAGC